MYNKSQMTEDNPSSNNLGLPSYEPPDWTISELYERSWQLVKKYKVLWVFGMAVAGLASGVGLNNFSNFGPSDTKSFEKYFISPSPQPDASGFTNILGATTSTPLTNTLSHALSLIPVSLYVLLGIEILALVVLGIIISLISGAWANSSLIHSIQTAVDGEKPTIKDSSQKAFSNIKPLIWLQFIPTLIFILVSISVFGILAAGIALSGDVLKIIIILLLIAAVVIWLYASTMLSLSNIWATRIVVLDKGKAFESLKSGFKISKNKFWSMVLLGLVNMIMSGIIVGLPIAVIAGFLLGGGFSLNGNSVIGIVLLTIGGILLIAFLLGFTLISGILTAFKASVWTLAYNKIKGKYEGK